MANNAKKYVLIKETKRDGTLIALYEYEVRRDAFNERDRRNKTSKKYRYTVMPLLVGRIARTLRPK